MQLTKIEENLTPKLYQILGTTIEILNADKGNIQFYDEKENALKIVAHIGFSDDFLKTFETVLEGHCCCGTAMARGERMIVEDTSKDPSYESMGSMLERFGFSAVQSTPLFDEENRFFGMISTHFKNPHCPTAFELHSLDRYLSVAAPLLARKKKMNESLAANQ
jgi:hypothetical protein